MFVFLVLCVAFSLDAKLAPLIKSSDVGVIENQYIVIFKQDTPVDVFERQLLNSRALVGENFGFEYKAALKGFSAKLSGDQLLRMRQNPFVEYIEVDQVMKVSQESCSDEPADSWGQTRVSQHEILLNGHYQATSTGGAGVTAYIVDTGIYIQHADFQGRASFGFKAEPSWDNQDSHGHGTHVASTTGGKLYGIAKKIQLVAVKVLGPDGSGSNSGVIAGIDFVVSEYYRKGKKPSTANLSLGGSKSSSLNAAVNSAVAAGIVFVVAAGNEDDDACYYSPASATDSISVGATDISTIVSGEKDVRSYFSNYGTCVDIFAPGSLITAAWIGSETAIATISGTSMASPHVCGVASLILGDSPSMTPAEVKNHLISTSNAGMIDMLCQNGVQCLKSPNYLVFNGC